MNTLLRSTPYSSFLFRSLLSACLGAEALLRCGGQTTFTPAPPSYPSQSVVWTVNSSAKETWQTQTLVNQSYHFSVGGPDSVVLKSITGGMAGTATFTYRLGITSWTLPGEEGAVSLDIYDGGSSVPFFSKWVDSFFQSSASGSGSFTVDPTHSYHFELQNNADAFLNGNGSVDILYPDHIRTDTHTANRTASTSGQAQLDGTQGVLNIGGFFAPLQPQAGGVLGGAQYALNWNNPNVLLVFSDTQTTTTSNPNADIMARTIAPPAIQQQPVSVAAVQGSTALLTAGAVGDGPLSYQWYFNGQPVEGATSSSLQLESLTPAAAGVYWVVVSNPVGIVPSAPTTLQVSVPPPPTPHIDSVVLAGNQAFLQGGGGLPGAAFYLLSTTDLEGGLWSSVATNYFDVTGGFTASQPVPIGMRTLFWKLVTP